MKSRKLVVRLPQGLHARSSSVLCKLAGTFRSRCVFEREGLQVDMKHIIETMSLSVNYGDEVTIYADGEDESEAIDRIADYLSSDPLKSVRKKYYFVFKKLYSLKTNKALQETIGQRLEGVQHKLLEKDGGIVVLVCELAIKPEALLHRLQPHSLPIPLETVVSFTEESVAEA